MKVTCILCNRTFGSEGAHMQSFPDPNLYVCLKCSVKQETINVSNQTA